MELKTILIVEDESSLLKALAMSLTKEGYEVLKSTNGQDGLKIAMEKHPDLILTDINMPVMDGLTMTKKIREFSWGKDLPIIILTNSDSMDNISGGIDDHVDSYQVKANTSMHDLIAIIKQKLDGKI